MKLKNFLAESVTGGVDVPSLLQRTYALHLTVHPKRGHQNQEEYVIVGPDYRRVVRSTKQWAMLLNQLEKRAKSGDRVSSAAWGNEDDPLAGTMAPLGRVAGLPGEDVRRRRRTNEGKRMKIKASKLRQIIKEELQLAKMVLTEAEVGVWPDAVDASHTGDNTRAFRSRQEEQLPSGVGYPGNAALAQQYDDEAGYRGQEGMFDSWDTESDALQLGADEWALDDPETIDDYADSPGVSTGTPDEIEPVLEMPDPNK